MQDKPSKNPGIKRFMITEFPVVRKTNTLAEVFSIIQKGKGSIKAIDYIYVVDSKNSILGFVPIRNVFDHPKSTQVGKIMETKIISAHPNSAIGKIAHLALKHDLKTIPIVEDGKLVGIIPPRKIIAMLNYALRKDILHLAGIHKSHLEYENSMKVPFFRSILHRMPWLIIGLFGIIATALFISIFDETLKKHVIFAFFIPTIVYLSAALGTQLQTLFIRDMAIMNEDLDFRKYILKQMAIASLISIVIAGIMFLVVSFFWKEPYIAFVIAVANFSSLIITSLIALLVTVFMEKLGSDPALGGGPIATVISDTTSIVIYFSVVVLLI
jgi:magnesium transporter